MSVCVHRHALVAKLRFSKRAIPAANETPRAVPLLRRAFVTGFVGRLACLPAWLPCQGGRAFLGASRALRGSAGSRPAAQAVGGQVGEAARSLPGSPAPSSPGRRRGEKAASGWREIKSCCFYRRSCRVSCDRGASQLGRWGCAGAGDKGGATQPSSPSRPCRDSLVGSCGQE